MGDDKRFGNTTRGKSHGLILAFACLAVVAGGCSKSEPEKAEKAEKTEKSDNACARYQPPAAGFGRQASFRQPGDDDLHVSRPGRADRRRSRQGARRRRLAGIRRAVHRTRERSEDAHYDAEARRACAQRVHHGRAGAEQRHQRAIQRTAAEDRSAVYQRRQRDRVLAGPSAVDPDHRRAGRQDAGFLPQGAWRARLGAMVGQAERQATGRRALRRSAQSAAPMPITSTTKNRRWRLCSPMQHADAGKIKVELNEWPIGILAKPDCRNGGNNGAAVDVSHLPRLEGAKENADRTSSDQRELFRFAARSQDTIAATKKLLARRRLEAICGALEEPTRLGMDLQEGWARVVGVFHDSAGKDDRTSEVRRRLLADAAAFADLPFPDDATDIVFDANRPYLNCVTAGTVEATLDFYRKELGAAGWLPLSAAEAAAQWPNAKLDGKPPTARSLISSAKSNGRSCFRCNAAMTARPMSKSRSPPFAEMQDLEAGQDDFGLPTPKRSKSVWRYRRPDHARGARPVPPKSAPCWRSIAANLPRAIGKKRPRAPSSRRRRSC